METKQTINWLRDKADRAPNLSWTRMLHKAAKQMAELLEENEALKKQVAELSRFSEDGWIPTSNVKDLPKEFVSVLIYIPSESPLPTVKEAYLADGVWATKTFIFHRSQVSHWKPMPEPPKEVNHA